MVRVRGSAWRCAAATRIIDTGGLPVHHCSAKLVAADSHAGLYAYARVNAPVGRRAAELSRSAKHARKVRRQSHGQTGSSMGAIWDFFWHLFRWPPSPREFVVRLFPEVEYALLTGLVARVTRLELTEVGAIVDLNLNQQAAMCIKRGALESVKLANGVWQAFWHSRPGTVFNTDGLQLKLKGSCMCRVAKPATLMLLSADDFEAELKVNQPLSEALGARGE